MGITLRDQGKLNEAIKAYNKAISRKPDYADAYWNNAGIAENIAILGKASRQVPIKATVYKSKINVERLKVLQEQVGWNEAIKSSEKISFQTCAPSNGFSTILNLPPLHFSPMGRI